MENWLLLVMSLPTQNATVRMRAWRALKASGAAVLRDGVYLLPNRDACRVALEAVAADVRSGDGTASLMAVDEPDAGGFVKLFDRSADYIALRAEIKSSRKKLKVGKAPPDLKLARRLRKSFLQIAEFDFFPGEARRQVDLALSELESAINRAISPDEPSPRQESITRLDRADYRGRLWATRQRPWVDRLASGWLIRRYIDPEARFLWLASASDCPADALGFDFDGAAFSHSGAKVTFETLLASFALESEALRRVGEIVHYLDTGGMQPNEAAGVERVLAGLRLGITDDDQLLEAASTIFDGLLAAFNTDDMKP